MSDFELIYTLIEIMSLNKEYNSITYYFHLRDYERMVDEIYWIENKYNVKIVTCNEMNSIISNSDFFETIYKKAVNFLNYKKREKISELVQELFS